jgi:hypothetical protein
MHTTSCMHVCTSFQPTCAELWLCCPLLCPAAQVVMALAAAVAALHSVL